MKKKNRNLALITGAGGLIGSESARFFFGKGFRVLGVDNDMRRAYFGREASVAGNIKLLEDELEGYRHFGFDLRDTGKLNDLLEEYAGEIAIIIHAAAQPSHDWAAADPLTDFAVNASSTLNLLETARKFVPGTVFIYTSTNKVYGDTPNSLPLRETESRWEIESSHRFFEKGVDESMSIDQSLHSLFGASKVSADILVQEYGRYYGMKTACFRCGCITGPRHAAAELHGFLSYLVKCALSGRRYTVIGYKGKQVRDNLLAEDLVSMFWHFFQKPRSGAVYNAGGGRKTSCSVMEAIRICEKVTGRKVDFTYSDRSRKGDHIWWISDTGKFEKDYPGWKTESGVEDIVRRIYAGLKGMK